MKTCGQHKEQNASQKNLTTFFIIVRGHLFLPVTPFTSYVSKSSVIVSIQLVTRHKLLCEQIFFPVDLLSFDVVVCFSV